MKKKKKEIENDRLPEEVLDCKTNSPSGYHIKCMKNAIENIHFDVRV